MSKLPSSKKMLLGVLLAIIAASWQGSFQKDISAAELPVQTHISPIELVSKVVERLAQSDETAQGLATKIGGSLIETEAPKSWEIVLPAPGSRLFCNAPERSAFVKSVYISFDLECNLIFRDLVNEFGTYKVIYESKTSSALFYQVKGSRIQIYAHLFWSKVGDASPVLSVDIRLE